MRLWVKPTTSTGSFAVGVGDKGMQAKLKSHGDRAIAVLLADRDARSAIPKKQSIRAFVDLNNADLGESKNIFVVSTGLLLPDVAAFVKHANSTKRLRGLLVRQDTYQSWITQLLDMADLRSLKNLLVHSDNEVVSRVLLAWNYGAQENLIADAAVLGDNLMLRDCALNRYVLPFSVISDLAAIKLIDRSRFEISEDGSRISWPDYCVDINLDSIKSALDPRPRKADSDLHDRLYGAAIAQLRKDSGLRQADIAGLDERHLRKIESGAQRATLRSLELLAKAHKLDINDYMNMLAQHVSKAKTGANNKK
jgi:hypothetical protein